MPRLLVVEDQKKLLHSLRTGLEEEGYDVVTATNGEQGYYAASTETVDAVVLDLMLTGRDGIRVLRDLRANGFAKPVLILTARDAVEDRVLGLDSGADDYLVKPFAFAELLARLRALLRRDVSGRELVLRADDLWRWISWHAVWFGAGSSWTSPGESMSCLSTCCATRTRR